MPKFIRTKDVKYGKRYEVYFPTDKSSGYSFPCDDKGEVPPLEGILGQNYYKCIMLEQSNKIKRELLEFETKEVIHAIIECECCKKPVLLYSSWANTCSNCGVEYDANGWRLAPREQWGEETGEKFF